MNTRRRPYGLFFVISFILIMVATFVGAPLKPSTSNKAYANSVDYYNRAFLGLEKPYVPEMWKVVKKFNEMPVDFGLKK